MAGLIPFLNQSVRMVWVSVTQSFFDDLMEIRRM
jgi:hypothetical protein